MEPSAGIGLLHRLRRPSPTWADEVLGVSNPTRPRPVPGSIAIRNRDGQGTAVSIWLPVPGCTGTAPAVASLRHRRDPLAKMAV
jgi:hypothetical protein